MVAVGDEECDVAFYGDAVPVVKDERWMPLTDYLHVHFRCERVYFLLYGFGFEKAVRCVRAFWRCPILDVSDLDMRLCVFVSYFVKLEVSEEAPMICFFELATSTPLLLDNVRSSST